MSEQNNKITIESLQWAQLERMKFIEQSLLWSRKVSISALCKAFDITRQQAHKDITIYRELAPASIKKPENGQLEYTYM